MIFTIMFLSAFYLLVAGGVGKQVHVLGRSKCHHNIHDWEKCSHYYSGIIAGLFWVIALPIAMGMKGSDSVPTPISKEVKEQKKREDELKRIQHQSQIDQAELMQAQALDKRLELVEKQAIREKRLLELESGGVNVGRLKEDAGIDW